MKNATRAYRALDHVCGRSRKPARLDAKQKEGGPWGNHGFHRFAEPVPALVEEGFDGTPCRVNRQPVAALREEWRVVDRWWTEGPVNRRYFEVVLGGGQNAVVFRDEARGGWFSQRGA